MKTVSLTLGGLRKAQVDIGGMRNRAGHADYMTRGATVGSIPWDGITGALSVGPCVPLLESVSS